MNHHRLTDSRLTKETFLRQYGEPVPNDIDWAHVPHDCVAVVWLRNSPTETVALIAIDRRSLDRCRSESDRRERKTYLVFIEDLIPHIDRTLADILKQRLPASKT